MNNKIIKGCQVKINWGKKLTHGYKLNIPNTNNQKNIFVKFPNKRIKEIIDKFSKLVIDVKFNYIGGIYSRTILY